jgi:hypothetical protein
VTIAVTLVFLMVVALGVAVDISARGQGFIGLWFFVGAFLFLAPHMDRGTLK